MRGRVEADAKNFQLPYTVLYGRDSDVISSYEIVKLPRIIILGKDGKIAFTERFASYEKLKAELGKVLVTKKETPPPKEAKPPKAKKPAKKTTRKK